MRTTLVCLAILATAATAGCGQSTRLIGPDLLNTPGAPVPSPSLTPGQAVTLSLRLSASRGSPNHPISAFGVARNQGATSAFYLSGCGEKTGVYFEVLDPDGRPVTLQDPTAPRPLCPEFEAELLPGQNLQRTLEFNGFLYSDDGTRFPAPAGIYTAVARFITWTRADHFDESTLEASESFLWLVEDTQPQEPGSGASG